MPIYEYTCQECGQRFEKLVRTSVPDQTITCPSCHSTQCAKSISLCCSTRSAGNGASASGSPSCAASG